MSGADFCIGCGMPHYSADPTDLLCDDCDEREQAGWRERIAETNDWYRTEIARLTRDLATETATRAALRTQESRIMGILADAGVPVGDVVAGVERLTRERDEATSAAVEQRERYLALCGKFNELVDSESNKALRAKVADLTRERDAALRWSCLWHREARRLWREVQAPSEEHDE